jgi:hypothetical protein
VRAWIALALLVVTCTGEPDTTLDGLWYTDKGRTILIQDGRLSLESGERIGSVEPLGDSAIRYRGPGGDNSGTLNVVLQVQHQTELRMTWTHLNGRPFRELTRIADVN